MLHEIWNLEPNYWLDIISLTATHGIVVVFFYLVGLVTIAERLGKKFPQDRELTRKIVHIGSGQVLVIAWLFQIPALPIVGASIITGTIAILSYFVPILPSINGVGRHSLGTLFYAVSIGILCGWFMPLGKPEFAVLGTLVMAWGDGMAAIVGRNWGRHPYVILGNKKSMEGSMAMAGFSFMVSLIVLGISNGFTGQAMVISAIVSLIAVSLESISQWGIDNISVPLCSAACAYGLMGLL